MKTQCRIQWLSLLTMFLLSAATATACDWLEILPRPVMKRGCVRLFRRPTMLVNTELPFALWAPPEASCAAFTGREDVCPDIFAPEAYLHDSDLDYRDHVTPPAFYKLTALTRRSVTHAVDMIPAGGDFYLLFMVVIERGPLELFLDCDFRGCEGRDMLGEWKKGLFIIIISICHNHSLSIIQLQ